MYEAEFKRVKLIDYLLQTSNFDALSEVVEHEFGRGLLGEDALNAARLLRLPATVAFLATLAVENLPKAHRQNAWLGVYQSLLHKQEQPLLEALPRRHPFKVFGHALVHGGEVDISALQACRAGMDVWVQAAELCVDQARFDLLYQLVQELARRRLGVTDWLLLAQTLINRHAYISKPAITEHLGHSYLRIRESLDSPLPALVSVRSHLALHAVRAYFASDQYTSVIEAARYATAPGHELHALYEMACAYCHVGQLDQSLSYLDRVISLRCTKNACADLESSLQKKPRDKSKMKGFDTEQAAQALVDLQQALAPIGQKAFLVSGTLLGYAREGRILAHDKDIDVGIIGWTGQYDVIAALLNSKRFVVDMRRLRGQKTHYLLVNHIKSGIAIDIFIYHPEGGRLVTGVEADFGYLQCFAFTPFELKSVRFLGIDFYVPDNVELNLEENFGDWRRSDPGYISHLESPSTVDVGGKVFQVVGRLHALGAIGTGNMDKLHRVIRIMEQHQQREGGMSDATLNVLRDELRNRTAELAEEAV